MFSSGGAKFKPVKPFHPVTLSFFLCCVASIQCRWDLQILAGSKFISIVRIVPVQQSPHLISGAIRVCASSCSVRICKAICVLLKLLCHLIEFAFCRISHFFAYSSVRGSTNKIKSRTASEPDGHGNQSNYVPDNFSIIFGSGMGWCPLAVKAFRFTACGCCCCCCWCLGC